MKRLDTVIDCVRDGSRVADIGCDHAHTVIRLVKMKKAPEALASDIRTGPLMRARENIARSGLGGYIKTRLCDGLEGIDEFAPDDIIIAGMGGELTAGIIEGSEYVKSPLVRLILQPMTCSYELRSYLCSAGFEITDERLCAEGERIYEVIVCRYTGQRYTLSEVQLHTGIFTCGCVEYPAFLEAKMKKFRTASEGKISSGRDAEYETSIISQLERLLLTNGTGLQQHPQRLP